MLLLHGMGSIGSTLLGCQHAKRACCWPSQGQFCWRNTGNSTSVYSLGLQMPQLDQMLLKSYSRQITHEVLNLSSLFGITSA